MPGKKITRPIKSEAQRRFFGVELNRAREGKSTRSGMSAREIKAHLEQIKGKHLPSRKGLLG